MPHRFRANRHFLNNRNIGASELDNQRLRVREPSKVANRAKPVSLVLGTFDHFSAHPMSAYGRCVEKVENATSAKLSQKSAYRRVRMAMPSQSA